MNNDNDSNEEFPPHRRGFLPSYGVELFFESKPVDIQPQLAAAGVDATRDRGRLAVALHDDRSVSGFASGPRPVDHGALAASLQQSWWWRDAGLTVKKCPHALLVADEQRTLAPLDRFSGLQRLLAPIVEALAPAALHWIPTRQFIKPAAFFGALREVGPRWPALGALNVRLFAVGSGDDMLMDTLGLGALGLWDLQCHFRGLEPSMIATWLLEVARASFLGQGDAPQNGQSLRAPNGAGRWPLRAEEALMAPERVVLDVDPGGGHEAGRRE